jgi:secreted Zn-dependent insulinase-like peptidase
MTLVFLTEYLEDDKNKSLKFIKQMLNRGSKPSFCEKMEIEKYGTDCSVEYERLINVGFMWQIRLKLGIEGKRNFHKIFLIFFGYLKMIHDEGVT